MLAESGASSMAGVVPSHPGLVLAFTGEDVAPYVLLLGLLLVTASLMMKLAKRRRGGSSSGPREANVTGAERLEKLRQEQGVRRDLDSLMVEIEEMAKRLSHQLDAKAVRLEQLIEDADHRLTRLRHVAERLENASPDASRSAAANTSQADAASPSADSKGTTSEADEPGDLLSASSPAASRASETPSPEASDPLTRSVYALADEGYDAQAIASRLQEHAGKIELILALRQP